MSAAGQIVSFMETVEKLCTVKRDNFLYDGISFYCHCEEGEARRSNPSSFKTSTNDGLKPWR
jgi:hypothetical protein